MPSKNLIAAIVTVLLAVIVLTVSLVFVIPKQLNEGAKTTDPLVQAKPKYEYAAPVDLTDGKLSAKQLTELSTTEFAIELYQQLAKEKVGDNLFFSPLSINIAMSMAYVGAAADTEKQMKQVLHYSGDQHKVPKEMQSVVDDVTKVIGKETKETQPLEITIANNIFVEKTIPLKDQYKKDIKDGYGVDPKEVDFKADAEKERKEINDWVESKTNKLIKNLLPEGSVHTDTVSVLVNAIYFKAQWLHQFDKESSIASRFTSLNGVEHAVKMMSISQEYSYCRLGNYQVVQLPYQQTDNVFTIVLPDKGYFKEVASHFSSGEFKKIHDNLSMALVNLKLPKFKIDESMELSEVLDQLGIEDAFDPDHADFSLMVDQKLYIDEVYHKAFCSIDEYGTEAAAATAVVMVGLSAPATMIDFTVDRPFLFFINNPKHDTILFYGHIEDLKTNVAANPKPANPTTKPTK